MDFKQAITDYSIKHYKLLTILMVVLTPAITIDLLQMTQREKSFFDGITGC